MELYVIFVENNSKNAAFHFSAEEYFTRYVKSEKPVIMLWQTEKTVMLGSNQLVSLEVNKEYADKNEIIIVRRSSGGGAIYTDAGTVLYTVIEPVTKDIKNHREDVAENIVTILNKIGAAAERKGRNDILIDSKKISGFAQYTSGNHVCTHGSLLFDADLDILNDVLIANPDKLQPKGISSIRSRVTNIKPYLSNDLSVGEFINIIKESLLSNSDYENYHFTNNDLLKIKQIENEKYANETWNYRM